METEFEEYNNRNRKWNVRSVLVPEWLSGMTRNHVGSARAGSNPAEHASYLLLFFSVLWVRRELAQLFQANLRLYIIHTCLLKISLQFPRSKLTKFWSLITFTIFWWHVQVEGCEPVHVQNLDTQPRYQTWILHKETET